MFKSSMLASALLSVTMLHAGIGLALPKARVAAHPVRSLAIHQSTAVLGSSHPSTLPTAHKRQPLTHPKRCVRSAQGADPLQPEEGRLPICRRQSRPGGAGAVGGTTPEGLTPPETGSKTLSPETAKTVTPQGKSITATPSAKAKAQGGITSKAVLHRIFVNPSGKDTNPGTLAQPFKTLGKALSVAKSGDLVKLAGGGYGPTSFVSSASGDNFGSVGLTVPAGVTIQGTLDHGGQVSSIFGNPGDIGLVLQGNATLKDLNFLRFFGGIHVLQGTAILNHLSMSQITFDIGLDKTAKASLINSSIFMVNGGTAVQVVGPGLTMDGGIISGGNLDTPSCNPAKGIDASGTVPSQITLKNGAQIINVGQEALFLGGNTKATLDHAFIANNFTPTCTPAPRVSLSGTSSLAMLNGTEIEDISSISATKSVGIAADKGSTSTNTITMQDSSVTGFMDRAILFLNDGSLTMNGGTVSNHGEGTTIEAGSKTQLTISNADIGNGGSDTIDISAFNLKLRNSRIDNSGFGILVQSGGKIDLGTLSDPGNNTFNASNVHTGMTFQGSFGTIEAVGNTWIPNIQGADASGHYTVHQTIDGTSPLAQGRNFKLFGADERIHL